MHMELLQVALTSIGSIIVLFILTKLVGNREMSQLSMFDYIVSITIGSIAAEMATSLEDFAKPLLAMVIYGFFTLIIALATNKSIKLRRIITGKALLLYDNGVLYQKNLNKARLDINEFLTLCRNSGYFNLANIQTAIMESNGKISFLPIAAQRPVTPSDMNLTPAQEKAVVNVVIDGKIMDGNLKATGNNEAWLKKQLHAQKISDISQVLLATCDTDNNLSVYLRTEKEPVRDIFE